MNEPYRWLQPFLTELPRPGELIALTVLVVCLLAGGHLIKRYWTDKNETVPLPVALVLWLGMFGIYFADTVLFYTLTPPTERLSILAWCLIFWVVPVIYFTYTIVNSLAATTIDRVGPFSAHIDDPSEFAAARKLALRGDVDGAVAQYRQYSDNQANALFEAARLLKSEDRYEEAAALYNEIATTFSDQRLVWAEASYQLAKLYEISLRQPREAMTLLSRILQRLPASRFGQLAAADLARLQVLDDSFLDGLEKAPVEPLVQDPFQKEKSAAGAARSATTPGAIDTEIPQDPFYKPRQQETSPAAGDGDGGPAARKRAARPQRTAAKRSAPAPQGATKGSRSRKKSRDK